MLQAYPKILSVGDPLIARLFDGEVVVEEKIDGSQFRVGFDDEGTAWFGSKGVRYGDEHPPDRMFVPAIEQARKHFATRAFANALFVFEYLATPKQNTLTYARVPQGHLALLDACIDGMWLGPKEKQELAGQLGLECAPRLYAGVIRDAKELAHLLERESFLGGTTVEGIVIKNFAQHHEIGFLFGMPLFGKFVREEFKELNRENWGTGVPIQERIMKSFPSEPRWRKAVQHLRERGELGHGVKDIGALILEVERDFREECREAAKELLWREYEHQLVASARKGFAEWFKNQLAEQAFDAAPEKETGVQGKIP